MKPIINLDELEMQSIDRGSFKSQYAAISDRIGGNKLGYNLTVCPPGKKSCPFHNHHANEEMFLILEGEGTLRFGEQEYPIRAHDVIACPPGKRDVAHQIINTGPTDLKYLAVSTRERCEAVEYPDSDKVGVMVGSFGKPDLRAIFPAEAAVDYFDREE